MDFAKYQGLGNDFIIVTEPIDGAKARVMCDRHFGVGADGVIVIGSSERADFSFTLYNADGGTAEVSGNGLRCIGRYLLDRNLAKPGPIKVETAGEIKVIEPGEGGRAFRVDMGVAVDEGEVFLHGRTWRKVDIGNPHVVTMVDAIEDAPVGELGPVMEVDPAFPDRTNVHFVQVAGDVIHARFWERGVGTTLACGTGACASLVASELERATVRGPGGDLDVEKDSTGRIFLTGPAEAVFEGRLL